MGRTAVRTIWHLRHHSQKQNMASKRRYTSKQVVEMLQNTDSFESESDSDSSYEQLKRTRTDNDIDLHILRVCYMIFIRSLPCLQ